MSGVRILLKNTETKRYLGRGGTWTDKPETALAFLDEVRAKDHSIYHRLSNTQVVVLAEAGATETPSTKIEIMKNTPVREEAIVKPRQNQSRIPKQAKTKENRRKSTKGSPLVDQMPEAPGRQTATKSRSAKSQPSETQSPTEPITIIQAKLDVGFGNSLFIRGQGGGVSWDKGCSLDCVDGPAWIWSTKQAKDKVVFKLLLNDQVWAKGEDVVVEAGQKIEIVPVF
jgi:hypothetical protein